MNNRAIQRLDEITINKIAAGEVIENPASVVKELVENALDAGSTEITVEILGGGRDLIRISDNGCGMSRSDALLCLERYATSKIATVEDIFSLKTMGFRGEALASISSIAKVTVLTSPRKNSSDQNEVTGTLLLCEGGNIISCSAAIRDPGTTIEVKSLFFNLPVRKKFQRSPAYDAQEIYKLLSILALTQPKVHFRLISNEKIMLNAPVRNSETFLKERVEEILGKEFVKEAFYLKKTCEGYQLEGFFSWPHFNRPNKTGQYLFINNRAISSFFIAQAVRQGYGSALAEGRHPLWVLYLSIPAGLVDVNVHPQKKEVRLRQEDLLKEIIVEGLRKSLLSTAGTVEKIALPVEKKEQIPFASLEMPAFYSFPIAPQNDFASSSSFQNVIMNQIEKESFPEQAPHFFEKEKKAVEVIAVNNTEKNVESSLQKHLEETISIFGITKTHILLDSLSIASHPKFANFILKEEGLVLLDIKAALERVFFEEFSQIKKGESAAQLLLTFPEFSLTAVEAAVVEKYLQLLHQQGIILERKEANKFILKSLPSFIVGIDSYQFILDLLTELQNEEDSQYLQKQMEQMLYKAALQQKIRKRFAGFTLVEANSLVKKLLSCEMPARSPEGKATYIQITQQELNNRLSK